MGIASSLRRARENAGISLRSVASTSGVGAGNLSAIERGLRDPTTATAAKIATALGIRFVPVKTDGRVSAAETIEGIAETEGTGDSPAAYRTFLQLANDLAAVSAVDRLLLTVEEPGRTGTRWDDAIAGLAEWRLQQAGAPLPDWIVNRRGRRDQPWEPQRTSFALALRANEDRVPEPLRRRGILIEEGELSAA
ncbi:helix-turn-helix domain-containing protein [Herbiconiux liukaitaii]|uniref:helix-turn-helix domain-containing protein n=1 Tax=Herbiconiux liukaitaii TaxID=3342799 RepID=UPI0035B725B1